VIVVLAAPGTEPWVPSSAVAMVLAAWTCRDLRLCYWPRARFVEVWESTHVGPGRDLAAKAKPYAWRGWATREPASIHIFVDETETAASILWLTLHELAHLELACAPLLEQAYRGEPKSESYWQDDAAHEARPEEQLANFVADELAPRLGSGPGYHRLWWRARVNAKGTAEELRSIAGRAGLVSQ